MFRSLHREAVATKQLQSRASQPIAMLLSVGLQQSSAVLCMPRGAALAPRAGRVCQLVARPRHIEAVWLRLAARRA